jgi:hypothetical protein
VDDPRVRPDVTDRLEQAQRGQGVRLEVGARTDDRTAGADAAREVEHRVDRRLRQHVGEPWIP